MTYHVLVTTRAERELNQATDWIAKNAPDTAERWFRGFVKAILTLEENPERCALARENPEFPFELRQLLYGRRRSYRALFTIR
jgi:plasmid stabilization system protein ParE